MPDANAGIVITGAGAVSALGVGCAALVQAIEQGRDGIRPIRRFSTESFSVHLGALVPEDEALGVIAEGASSYDFCFHFARLAATEALRQARIFKEDSDTSRIALVMGTSLGDQKRSQHHTLAVRLATHLGLRGPLFTVSTACSSSTNAIGMALELLKDSVDTVLAGGADVLTPEVFAGFHALGVLSTEKCAPFSRPQGTTLGEGAGFLVLENAGTAARRGVQPLAAISGYGLSADAFHETSPDPFGDGVARALQSALRHAGLPPEEIGYINAHGTGTANNDSAEWMAIQKVFGSRANHIPVSSTKGHLGHAQGAAGVLELLATLLLVPHQQIPPTLHFRGARPRSPADPVGTDQPRTHRYRHAACINSAFGGANAALILSEAGRLEAKKFSQPLEVVGLGAVGKHGLDLKDFEVAIKNSPPAGRIPAYDIDQIVTSADPRGMDPATKHLIAASARALADAGIVVHGSLRERTGLIVGTTRISSSSVGEFAKSIIDRGLAGCSPTAFARIVLNAPAGTCSKVLMLKGPTSTLTVGPGTGLAAIIYAAQLLSSREDIDLVLAGGFDEPDPLAGTNTEGAGCIALAPLGRFPSPRGGGRVCLAGFGVAGPNGLQAAVERALNMAGVTLGDVDMIFGPMDTNRLERILGRFPNIEKAINCKKLCGGDEAAASAQDCIAACLALRRGECRVALVVTEGQPCAACAAILTAWRT